MIIQAWTHGRYFLNNKVSLSLQGKQLIFLVINNKIWASKKKLEFCKFIFDLKLHDFNWFESFPISKNFTDVISGDCSKCDSLLC